MSATPFSDLVSAAAGEQERAGNFKTAELLRYITSAEVEAEQERARSREQYESSITAQLATINAGRMSRGEPVLSRSEFLAGD